MTETVSRRRLLQSGSVAGLLGLAGCTGQIQDGTTEGEDEGPQPDGDDAKSDGQDSQGTRQNGGAESAFSEEIREKARRVGTQVQESVVKISFDGGKGGGTGWILDDGSVVTNSHIARRSRTFEVETFGGERGTAERVGYHQDMTPDVALLETDISGVPRLSQGSTDALEKGQPMVIVGHPGRVGEWVISLGPFYEYKEGVDWLLTDAPTAQGNSGSPLVTLEGDIVGCVSGGTFKNGRPETVSKSETVFEEFPDRQGVSTAIPIETIRKWVTEWE